MREIVRKNTSEKVQELLKNLTSREKDELYKALEFEYVREDVECQLEQNINIPDNLSDDAYNDIVDDITKKYVYDRDYDCDLSYWENIDNFIDCVDFSEYDEELY